MPSTISRLYSSNTTAGHWIVEVLNKYSLRQSEAPIKLNGVQTS
jgi:hypothetical protein